ncbi:MAG: hypothetical protein HYS57_00460 [Parcubacteria group bacterium]|nr:hypothetical protein [Parcubacteria group bacterium]
MKQGFLRKNAFWVVVAFSAFLNIVSWIWIYLKVPGGSFPFIVHYNIYFGHDLLGERIALFQLPLTGTLILFINATLGRMLLGKKAFWGWVVLFATVLWEAFVLYGSWIIVSINS